MIFERTYANGHSRLALIFAGWGMDAHPFAGLKRQGYDMAVVYDYAASASLPDWLKQYSEICLIAWSYGVCMAERFLAANPWLPITLKVAVNGTPEPVNDNTGIPHSIYQGTLDGLSERSVYKFYRRICTDSNAFNSFKSAIPQRTLPSLKKELALFGSLPPTSPTDWDIVYVSDNDAIIPATNQRNAWHSISDVRVLDGGHMPDFNFILENCLIDKTDVEHKFRIHSPTYNCNATVQRHMCGRIAETIINLRPAPHAMIEIGTGTGILTKLYNPHLNLTRLELWDLTGIPTDLPGIHRKCDAEISISRVTPYSIDLIASSATIQWMNSPKKFVTNCANVLRNGGTAIFSTFGPDTFREIAPMLPSPLHYIPSNDWKRLKLHGCDIDVSEEMHTLQFESPRQLLRHISSTGVNGCGIPAAASQKACRAILASGIRTLSYHCIYITVTKQ